MNAARSVKALLASLFAFAIACASPVFAADDEALHTMFKSTPLPPPVDCDKPTMTAEEFIDMVHTIAMHGDLRDIPFVARTLQEKLIPQPTTGGKNVHWILYHMPAATNKPSFVLYNVHDDSVDSRSPIKPQASIIFSFRYFKHCRLLTKEMIDSRFFGTVQIGSVSDGGGLTRAINFTVNKAKIGIAYVYKPEDGTVIHVSLGQLK